MSAININNDKTLSRDSAPQGPIDAEFWASKFQISEDKVKQYYKIFSHYDKDNEGCISNDKVGSMMKESGKKYSEEELQKMIEEVDIDGNGSIDFEEFMTMVTAGKQYSKKDVLSALNILDKSKSGSLDSEELRRLLTTRGEILEDYEIEEFMMLAARFASDKGSRISVDELAVSLASKF